MAWKVHHNISKDGPEAPTDGLQANQSISWAVGRQAWRCFVVGSSDCWWQHATGQAGKKEVWEGWR